ncbi:MAG: hypothetical protein EXS18_01760 [Verrucomicrobiae bacterium]|nr:hypothetical protein [Verrucomicrobiae bacterium]
MKRFAGILAIQFVVIFAAGFLGSWAFAHWRSAPSVPVPTAQETSWFQSELGVDSAQAARLTELDKKFEVEQARICEQHCAKRVELAGMIKNGDAMTPPMETLSRELCDLEAKSQRVTLDHIFAVGKELNASQREKFTAKVHDQMCGSCPMGMHKPGSGKQASASCGSAGCTCCVTSDDHQSSPAQPIAQLTPPQPRLDWFTQKTDAEFHSVFLAPSEEFDGSTPVASRSSSLCVLYSVFRI